MGEYIQIGQNTVKIGTCEDLYYTTYEKLAKAVKLGAKQVPGNDEPRNYLKEEQGNRYRFPFPDEANLPIGYDYDPFRAITLQIPRELDLNIIGDHLNCQKLNENGGFRGWLVELVQERLIKGKLLPVFKCSSCGAKFRIEKLEMIKLITSFMHETALEIQERGSCQELPTGQLNFSYAKTLDQIAFIIEDHARGICD